MLDPRLDPDTLFWVFEPDFRFYPPGQNPQRWLTHAGQFPVQELTALRRPQDAEPTASKDAAPSSKWGQQEKGKGAKPAGQVKRLRGSYAELGATQRKGGTGVGPSGSQLLREVMDVMLICQKAHEQKAGDIMWLSYNADKRKPSRVGFGSQFIAVSVSGARHMLRAMQPPSALESGHWDLVLKTWLLAKPNRQQEVGFSYIHPPIGNFVEHTSGCCANPNEWRAGLWSEPWVCPGTRQVDDPKQRQKWLCQMVREGQPTWIARVIDFEPTAEVVGWKSCWNGQYQPPHYMMNVVELRESLMNKDFRRRPGPEPPAPQYKGPGVKGKGVGKCQKGKHHGELTASKRQVRRQRRRAGQWDLRTWIRNPDEAADV